MDGSFFMPENAMRYIFPVFMYIGRTILERLITMGGKVHQTEEEKFRASLESWSDEEDNRPFIRTRIDKEKDQIAYQKKWDRIHEEKRRIAAITGDPIERINLIDAWGQIYSKGGNVRDFKD